MELDLDELEREINAPGSTGMLWKDVSLALIERVRKAEKLLGFAESDQANYRAEIEVWMADLYAMTERARKAEDDYKENAAELGKALLEAEADRDRYFRYWASSQTRITKLEQVLEPLKILMSEKPAEVVAKEGPVWKSLRRALADLEGQDA